MYVLTGPCRHRSGERGRGTSAPTFLALLERATNIARPILQGGNVRRAHFREVSRRPGRLAAVDRVAISPMKHEIVRRWIAVTVHYVSARVLACPVEVAPVIFLEDHKRRLHLDCHAPTVSPKRPTVPGWGTPRTRPGRGAKEPQTPSRPSARSSLLSVVAALE